MAQIVLYGIIGDATGKLDAASVTASIRAASGDLTVLINSPGGYVFEGLAIYQALASYDRGAVIIQIDGLAASMASLIAMAGDRIIMAESALMMIHRPWDATIGNAADMRADASRLEKIEEQLVGIYAKRTGIDVAQLSVMLAAETWMNADEALALGFITATSQPLKIAAMADVSPFGFHNLPDRLKGSNVMPEMNAAEVTQVRALCAAHKLPDSVANQIFRDKMDLPSARAHILEQLADYGDALNIGHLPGSGGTPANDATLDNPAFHAQAVGDAIYYRISGRQPQGAAVELMDASMIDMAREMLERRGVRNATRLRPSDVLEQASWNSGRSSGSRNSPWLAPTARGTITHQSGDFPSLLQGAGQRFLLETYQAASSALKPLARKRSANDFRSLTGVQLSGFGTLANVSEGGELKYGTLSERKETYAVGTFGKLFSLSRNAIVNDDLGAFNEILRIMGRAAAETEAMAFANLLNSNPVMGDSNAVFSTPHGNLAGTGYKMSLNALNAGRTALRVNKDIDGVTVLNIKPKWIVVPPAWESIASVVAASSWNPVQPENASSFSGDNVLGVVIEPRLADPVAWYLFADALNAAASPIMEYAYLGGEEGPQTDSKEGWGILGMEFRVVFDFGVGMTGYQGAFKNPGSTTVDAPAS